MKLKLAIASLSLVAISFTACGGEDNKETAAPKPAAETPAPEVKAETPAPAVEETPAPAVEETASAEAPKTGAELFAKCVACHGQNAEKSALGKSQVIAGWDIEKTKTAINGYKDGTYGGAMKGLMKGQVATLSDADVETLAEYISGL
jgi:cytochrome c553